MLLRHVTSFLAFLFILSFGFSQAGVNYEIRNGQVSGSNYEFDVFMNASQLGTLNSRGQLYLQYNPAAFGADLVQHTAVIANFAGILNQAEPQTGLPKYSLVNITDNNPTTLAITWQSNFMSFPASQSFQSAVPATSVQIFHVSLPMINTSQPAGLAFDQQLMGGQQFYVLAASTNEIAYTTASASLPVELLGFYAEKIGSDVQLTWLTSREINNKYFEVEKSTDGQGFEAVGKIGGQGTTDTETAYDFLDQSEMGTSNIYRLKQVDIDGTYSYSERVEIRFEQTISTNHIAIYPVPAKDFLTVEVLGKVEGNVSLEIYDTQGKRLWAGSLEAHIERTSVDISQLPAGSYILKVSSGIFQEAKQFIKID